MNEVKVEQVVGAIMAPSDIIELPPMTPIPVPDSIVITLAAISGIPYYLVTCTAYDRYGEKNYKAIDLSSFLAVVTKIEDSLLRVTYEMKRHRKAVMPFENTVYGSQRRGILKEFALYARTHRYAFVRDDQLGLFLRELTQPSNTEEWAAHGVNVEIQINT